ncbi:MAG: rhodanese-like domain-containing protein [Haloarculaceae archaeon]
MVERFTPAQLRERLDADEDVQVIDTRPPAAYAAGHVPGAENLPYGELADRIADVDWSEAVVLVCREGVSSVQAGRILESYEGVDDDATVASLEGGYEDWDGPLERED